MKTLKVALAATGLFGILVTGLYFFTIEQTESKKETNTSPQVDASRLVEILDLEEVNNKAALAVIVEKVKKAEPDFEKLTVDFISRAFIFKNPKWPNDSFILTSDCFLEPRPEFLHQDEYPFPTHGSAGCVVRIFRETKGKKIQLVFSENLIDLLGVLNVPSKHPIFVVRLHGINFGRAGNAYGFATLEYEKIKYDYKRDERRERIIEWGYEEKSERVYKMD